MKPLLHWLLTLAFTASAFAAQHFDIRTHGAMSDGVTPRFACSWKGTTLPHKWGKSPGIQCGQQAGN